MKKTTISYILSAALALNTITPGVALAFTADVTCPATTKSSGINFKYSDGGIGTSFAFDGNLDTYDTIDSTKVIKWEGDLGGKVIQFKPGDTSEGNEATIKMRDASGKEIGFYSFEHKEYIYALSDMVGGTYNFIVPENAVDIVLETKSSFKLYELGLSSITVSEDVKLKNVSVTAGYDAVEISWELPTTSDFKEIEIVRDGGVIATTTSTSFVDKALDSNKKYNYGLVVINNADEVIYSCNVTATTKDKGNRPIFSGVSGAIDGIYSQDDNLDTYDTVQGSVELTASSNLQYSKLDISLSSESDVKIKVKGADGKYVKFYDEETKTYVSELTYSKVSRASSNVKTFSIALPENAKTIEIATIDGSEFNLHNIKQTGTVISTGEIKKKINNTLKAFKFSANTSEKDVKNAIASALVNENVQIEVTVAKNNATNPTQLNVKVKVTRGNDVISVSHTANITPVQNSQNTNNGTTTKPSTTVSKAKVINYDLNMRSSASYSGKVLTTIKVGQTVEYISKTGDFAKVKYNGKTGYVVAKHLQMISDKPTTSTGSSSNTSSNSTSTKTGTVSASTLNVRSGASTKHSIVTKLKKGSKVTILETKNGWHKVKTSNGKTGWVSADYIKK